MTKYAKLVRHLTPEEDTLFRAMVHNRCSQNELVIEFKCAAETAKRWLAERGLKLNPRLKGRPKKRVERVDLSQLETVVDELRRRYSPVFAEDTARYPSQTPHRYSAGTLFRVGKRRNVTAAELVRL